MSRAHTISLIRHLEALGHVKPRRRPGRVPAPKRPDQIGSDYREAIIRHACEPARAEVAKVLPEIMRLLADHRRALGHTDARADVAPRGYDPPAETSPERTAAEEAAAERESRIAAQLRGASASGKRAAKLIDDAARTFAEKFRPDALHAVVAHFGKATDKHARAQLDQQLRTAIGVPLSAIEKPHQDRLGEWTAGNVALIKTVPARYLDRVQEDVLEAFAGGTHPSTLADQLADDYDMSENDAERIARDQTLKLSADLNHARMESLGVEWATWRTVRDERVSDDCEEFEGVEFVLAEGMPPDGVMPGENHVLCRCWSEPDLSPLLGVDED